MTSVYFENYACHEKKNKITQDSHPDKSREEH